MIDALADPAFEKARLDRLRDYAVLGTAAERDFDDIAALASDLCATPIALVSLVDEHRQWFKARVGLDIDETPRDMSFCAHAMYSDTVLQIPDALLDERFATNPLVLGDPYIRFYAGAPLVSPSGHPLGTLCVIDRVPRELTTAQRQGLLTLARHVLVQLDLRQYARTIEAANHRLREAERMKDEFIARVSHELRTPLSSIRGYLEILDDTDLPPAATAKFMATIRRNSDRLMNLVDDMLLAAQLSSAALELEFQRVDLAVLAKTAVESNRRLAEGRGLTIDADADDPVPADADPRRLAQALDRLVLNAMKFTSSGGVVIHAVARDGHPVLEVRDTGVGIAIEEQARLFAPFRRTRTAEETEVQGSGLGLAIVKAIVDGHRGSVVIDSGRGVGTTVVITLPETDPVPAQPAPVAAAG